MATPFFVADSARVTILRPLASSAFGTYTLELPEGIDIEDVHDFEAPGNELGHVSNLTQGRRVGGLARRFVRADVSVTADDPSDLDDFPASDVDAVLTAAAKQVSSDFFLESDISKAGLGPWVPFVDFQVGDPANVEVWGHVVTLPVTRIEQFISDHDLVDWRVHVGGQLVSDEDARLVENEALRKALIQDRRELAGIEAATQRQVAAAQAAATAAQERVERLNADLTGTPDGDLAQAVAAHAGIAGEIMLKAEEFGAWSVEKQEDLNTAFALAHDYQSTINEGNLIAWTTQTEWNEQVQALITEGENRDAQMQEVWGEQAAQQERVSAANSRAVEAIRLATTTRVAVKKLNVTVQGGMYISALNYNGSLKITIKQEWVGRLVVMRWVGTASSNVPDIDTVPITALDWGTTKTYTSDFDAMIFVEPDPGVPMVEKMTVTEFILTNSNTWYTLPGVAFTAVEAGDHAIAVSITWPSVSHLPIYSTRVMVDGVQVALDEKSNWGPLFGNDKRTQTLRLERALLVGQVVTVQVKTSAGIDGRVIRPGSMTVTYTSRI